MDSERKLFCYSKYRVAFALVQSRTSIKMNFKNEVTLSLIGKSNCNWDQSRRDAGAG